MDLGQNGSLEASKIVRDQRAFKARLGIGGDVYTSTKVLKFFQSVVVVIAIFCVAIVGAIALFLMRGMGLLLVLLPIVLLSVFVFGGKKLGKSIAGPVDVIPHFINSPIDQLASSLLNLMAPIALRVIYADGKSHKNERHVLRDHFIQSWGYHDHYVDQTIDRAETNLPGISTEEATGDFAEFCKTNPDCNLQSITIEFMDFLRELIAADGRKKDAEMQELARIQSVFDHYHRSVGNKLMRRAANLRTKPPSERPASDSEIIQARREVARHRHEEAVYEKERQKMEREETRLLVEKSRAERELSAAGWLQFSRRRQVKTSVARAKTAVAAICEKIESLEPPCPPHSDIIKVADQLTAPERREQAARKIVGRMERQGDFVRGLEDPVGGVDPDCPSGQTRIFVIAQPDHCPPPETAVRRWHHFAIWCADSGTSFLRVLQEAFPEAVLVPTADVRESWPDDAPTVDLEQAELELQQWEVSQYINEIKARKQKRQQLEREELRLLARKAQAEQSLSAAKWSQFSRRRDAKETIVRTAKDAAVIHEKIEALKLPPLYVDGGQLTHE